MSKTSCGLIRVALGATVLVYLGGCGSGGGSGGGGTETTISGNVAQRSAFRGEARSSMWALLRSLRFVGSAYAHSGVNGLDVCVESCPQGLNASGDCDSPEEMNLCTLTDSGGNFTVRGEMSGDLCIRVTDADDPGFLGRSCVGGVSQGATVMMSNMNCHEGNHTCRGNVEMAGGGGSGCCGGSGSGGGGGSGGSGGMGMR